MSSLILIMGLGIASFILLYFAMQLKEDSHFLLKLLCLFFVVYLLALIPKAALDDQAMTSCENLINSSYAEGNLTTFTYKPFCYPVTDSSNNTASIFLKIIT